MQKVIRIPENDVWGKNVIKNMKSNLVQGGLK